MHLWLSSGWRAASTIARNAQDALPEATVERQLEMIHAFFEIQRIDITRSTEAPLRVLVDVRDVRSLAGIEGTLRVLGATAGLPPALVVVNGACYFASSLLRHESSSFDRGRGDPELWKHAALVLQTLATKFEIPVLVLEDVAYDTTMRRRTPRLLLEDIWYPMVDACHRVALLHRPEPLDDGSEQPLEIAVVDPRQGGAGRRVYYIPS